MSNCGWGVTLMFLVELCQTSLAREILSLYQTLETKGSQGVGSWNVGNHTFVGVIYFVLCFFFVSFFAPLCQKQNKTKQKNETKLVLQHYYCKWHLWQF